MLPNNIPNLYQILFKGVSNWDFSTPKNKKIVAIMSDQTLISPWYIKGYKPISVKTIKKTMPKLLLELILIFLFKI